MEFTDRDPPVGGAGGRISGLAAICVLAVLVALGLSPSVLAGGRNDVYVGEVEQSAVKGFGQQKAIELYVHTQHHRDGRVTIKIPVVNIFDLYATCRDGSAEGVGFNAGGTTSKLDLRDITVSHRSFKSAGVWQDLDRFAFQGSLPKHGPARGTVEVTTEPAVVEAGEGEREHLGRCRSGLLNWSAVRK